MIMNNVLTQSYLKSIMTYDAESGLFIWKVKRKKVKQGSVVGTNGGHYLQCKIDGKTYRLHRLAWLYVYGYLPVRLDHIDGNKLNNSISNLREVSSSENSKNLKRAKNNTSGVTGVGWHKARSMWRAYIIVGGKQVHLGNFVEYSEAVNARKNAEVLYGFHENHGRIGVNNEL